MRTLTANTASCFCVSTLQVAVMYQWMQSCACNVAPYLVYVVRLARGLPIALRTVKRCTGLHFIGMSVISCKLFIHRLLISLIIIVTVRKPALLLHWQTSYFTTFWVCIIRPDIFYWFYFIMLTNSCLTTYRLSLLLSWIYRLFDRYLLYQHKLAYCRVGERNWTWGVACYFFEFVNMLENIVIKACILGYTELFSVR